MPPLPPECRLALKEWASVVRLLEQGEQVLLVRKGGLIDPGEGFEVRAPVFLFYPTREHQTVNYLRPRFVPEFERALGEWPTDGQLHLRLVGVAAEIARVRDADAIRRLEWFHPYNDAFIEQRLRWQPGQPLVLVAVRAYRLPRERVLPARPDYAGCKSWVDLDQPVDLTGAKPVLSDEAFNKRIADIKRLLA